MGCSLGAKGQRPYVKQVQIGVVLRNRIAHGFQKMLLTKLSGTFSGACEDDKNWRDSKHREKGCSVWKAYDCSKPFDGWDPPATVMEKCKRTCGLCSTPIRIVVSNS